MSPDASSWSRTWRVLAATARAKPVPPDAIETWPLEPSVDEAPVHQLAPSVGGEAADAASSGQQPVEGDRDAGDQLVVRSVPIRGADLGGVEVLEHDPSARRERGDDPIEDLRARRHVLEHETLVDQIPRPHGQLVGHQVVAAHLQLVERTARNREMSRSVATHATSGRPAAPTRTRSIRSPRAKLEAPPARTDSCRECWMVSASNVSSNASKRLTVSARVFVRRYSDDSSTPSPYAVPRAPTDRRRRSGQPPRYARHVLESPGCGYLAGWSWRWASCSSPAAAAATASSGAAGSTTTDVEQSTTAAHGHQRRQHHHRRHPGDNGNHEPPPSRTPTTTTEANATDPAVTVDTFIDLHHDHC